MASYTITGHPLNLYQSLPGSTNADALDALLQANGVGQTITITLSGPEDTIVKALAVLQ